jgi:NAD(P)-dependent dehydrogenase (short-subunit alcohol dehydrogenase family)
MSSILITGSGRGIGRATALELARRGHRVIATARDPGQLADLPVDLRLQLDVTDAQSIEQAIRAAGPIDVLISNAGGMFMAPVEATPPDQLERLLEQNTVGALRVVQAVLPGMRERGRGRLLFMSSILGRMTSPTRGAFAATKWALEALVETLASEVGHFGVEVVLLEPSSVASGALETAPHYVYPGENDPYGPLEAQIDGGRAPALSVEEVATAIADTIEADTLPLRIPIGEAARRVLAARQAASDDAPFRLAPVTW